MTFAGWVIFFAVCVPISGFVIYSMWEMGKPIVGVFAALLVTSVILGLMLFYYRSTAAGKRAFKSQESSFNNGIERTVEVYDATGNLLKSYSGKFDIDYDSNRIVFDDENNKRHVIYYPTGTVIVDET